MVRGAEWKNVLTTLATAILTKSLILVTGLTHSLRKNKVLGLQHDVVMTQIHCPCVSPKLNEEAVFKNRQKTFLHRTGQIDF